VQAFARGELYQQGEAWNLGLRAGLHGMMSLAPLVAAGAIAVVIWWRMAWAQQETPISADVQPLSARRQRQG
jgi:hypothetical protein